MIINSNIMSLTQKLEAFNKKSKDINNRLLDWNEIKAVDQMTAQSEDNYQWQSEDNFK